MHTLNLINSEWAAKRIIVSKVHPDASLACVYPIPSRFIKWTTFGRNIYLSPILNAAGSPLFPKIRCTTRTHKNPKKVVSSFPFPCRQVHCVGGLAFHRRRSISGFISFSFPALLLIPHIAHIASYLLFDTKAYSLMALVSCTVRINHFQKERFSVRHVYLISLREKCQNKFSQTLISAANRRIAAFQLIFSVLLASHSPIKEKGPLHFKLLPASQRFVRWSASGALLNSESAHGISTLWMFILITRSNIIFFTASWSSSYRDLPVAARRGGRWWEMRVSIPAHAAQ